MAKCIANDETVNINICLRKTVFILYLGSGLFLYTKGQVLSRQAKLRDGVGIRQESAVLLSLLYF